LEVEEKLLNHSLLKKFSLWDKRTDLCWTGHRRDAKA
jgi:hypothetical protein